MNFSEAESWMIDAADQEVNSLCGNDGEFYWNWTDKRLASNTCEIKLFHEDGSLESRYEVVQLTAITPAAEKKPPRYVVLMEHYVDGDIDSRAVHVGEGFTLYE